MKDEATYKRLTARCKADGDCRVWPYAPNGNGSLYVRINGKYQPVRRVLWQAKNGEIPKGRTVGAFCITEGCVEHLQLRTRSQVNKETMKWVSANRDYRMKVAHGKRRDSKLSQEAANEMRLSDEAATAVAAKHGVSAAYVRMIRRGEVRRDYSNPYAVLGL